MSAIDPLDREDLIDDGTVEHEPVDDGAVTVQEEPATEPEPQEQTPELVYGSVDEWLRRYWRFAYRRTVSKKGSGTGRWRADWWTIDEALQRLEALLRGWEASRQDAGTGTSAWWLNHADPHMAILLSVDGPFAGSQDETERAIRCPICGRQRRCFRPTSRRPASTTTPCTHGSRHKEGSAIALPSLCRLFAVELAPPPQALTGPPPPLRTACHTLRAAGPATPFAYT